MPVFETGALPVRLTLRIRSQFVTRYWMTSRHLSISALSRIRTCILVTLIHAPLPVGLPERSFLTVDPGGIRTLISWVQARRPAGLDDGPVIWQPALREGVEPSSPAFGGPGSDPLE